MRDKELKRATRGSSCCLLQYWKVLALPDSKGDIKNPSAEQTRAEHNRAGFVHLSYLGDSSAPAQEPPLPIISGSSVKSKQTQTTRN